MSAGGEFFETGIIKHLPHRSYIELHQPLGPVDEHGHPIPLAYQGAAVPNRMNKLGSAGAPGNGSILTAEPVSEHDALTEAAHAAERKALTALRTYQHDGSRRNDESRSGRSSDTADDGVGGSRAKSH